jgi:hypothetical protein
MIRVIFAAALALCVVSPAAAQSTDDRYAGAAGASPMNAQKLSWGARQPRRARLAVRGRFNCGIAMMAITGRREPGLALARSWLRFPRTVAGPGAVVVQSRKGRALGGGPGGHVSRIVEMRGSCRALVQDNRGTYERDICSRLLGYVRA